MPPLKTTLGQILINQALPEDLRDYNRVLDKKGVGELTDLIGQKYPERYREIVQGLSNVGRHAAYTTGGNSFGLKAMQPAAIGKVIKYKINQELHRILATSQPEAARNKAITEMLGRYQKVLTDGVRQESRDEDNPIEQQLSGAGRGNPGSLNSLRGADLMYVDHRGDPIPFPVMHSYSEGLEPDEYFAGAFGARKGIIDLKSATQDAGFFAKQLTQAAHRLVVTADDSEDPYDEASPRGLPVPVDDPDNDGALLAHPVAGIPRNTRLTPKLLKHLRSEGIDEILVRSPMVGGPPDGGVYSKDVGYHERGRAPIGDYVGITAANVLSNPITQAQISSKHSGGVAGASAGAIGGFKHINALVQVPETYKGWATHADTDGRVEAIAPAEQGGHYVTIGGKSHYVPAYADINVQKGDEVEAGDAISTGTVNPKAVVQHKGIGEGQRYLMQVFHQAMKDSDAGGNRRNVELIARGLVNHVRLTDEVGDWVQDDVVPYNQLEQTWQPRPGYSMGPPHLFRGQYLEKPVLHYSIGTKIGPRVLAAMQKHNVGVISAHPEAPPFEPEMIRGMANISHDPDPITRGLGSYQQKSFLHAAQRGDVSDTAGTSFVPALAEGKDFGVTGPTKGWEPAKNFISPP